MNPSVLQREITQFKILPDFVSFLNAKKIWSTTKGKCLCHMSNCKYVNMPQV